MNTSSDFSLGDRIYWSDIAGWWYMVDSTDDSVWEMDISGYRVAQLPADSVELQHVEAGSVVLSRADAEWLCGVIHGEAQGAADYDRAHALLEGGRS